MQTRMQDAHVKCLLVIIKVIFGENPLFFAETKRFCGRHWIEWNVSSSLCFTINSVQFWEHPLYPFLASCSFPKTEFLSAYLPGIYIAT